MADAEAVPVSPNSPRYRRACGYLGAVGRLAPPFALTLPAGFAYYLVYPPRAVQRPSVKAFRDWLMAEARSRTGKAQTPVANEMAPRPTSRRAAMRTRRELAPD